MAPATWDTSVASPGTQQQAQPMKFSGSHCRVRTAAGWPHDRKHILRGDIARDVTQQCLVGLATVRFGNLQHMHQTTTGCRFISDAV